MVLSGVFAEAGERAERRARAPQGQEEAMIEDTLALNIPTLHCYHPPTIAIHVRPVQMARDMIILYNQMYNITRDRYT